MQGLAVVTSMRIDLRGGCVFFDEQDTLYTGVLRKHIRKCGASYASANDNDIVWGGWWMPDFLLFFIRESISTAWLLDLQWG